MTVSITTNKQSLVVYTSPIFGPGTIVFQQELELLEVPLVVSLELQAPCQDTYLTYEILLDSP